jgi:hypothetical protein
MANWQGRQRNLSAPVPPTFVRAPGPEAVHAAPPAVTAPGREATFLPSSECDDTADAVDAPTFTESQRERLRRRAAFLRDLAEAKELRARVRPRHTRVVRLREALRRATYRSA